MNRLHYVDIARGSAVLSMVFFQVLHGIGLINLYDHNLWFSSWVNWFPLFMIIVGFSLKLSFKRPKGFVKRNISRATLLIFVGSLLCILMGWTIFNEAISGIGLTLLVMTFAMHFVGSLHPISWFLMGFASFIVSANTFAWGVFNPFWLMSFMFVGVGLCGILES